ncbi:MAG: hypothetical protein IIT37_04855, partial [Bacteroidales bacterium]|nr:hypothetical protein [Bacteroidales bacterium]
TMATPAFGHSHSITITFQHSAKFIKPHIFVKRQNFGYKFFPTRHKNVFMVKISHRNINNNFQGRQNFFENSSFLAAAVNY